MHCQEINLSCEVVSFKNVNPQSTEEFVHKEFERQTNKTLASVMSSATLLIIDEGQNVFRFSFWTQLKAVLNPSEEQCSVICCSAFDANRVMGTLVSPVCFLENLKFNLDFLCFDGDEIDDLVVIFKKRYADRDYRLFSERILKLLGDSSKGIPGLFYAGLDLLSDLLVKDFKNTEEAFYSRLISQPSFFFQKMHSNRCFVPFDDIEGLDRSDENAAKVFESLICQLPLDTSFFALPLLSMLTFRGVVLRDGSFSCPMTAHFYRKEFFKYPAFLIY